MFLSIAVKKHLDSRKKQLQFNYGVFNSIMVFPVELGFLYIVHHILKLLIFQFQEIEPLIYPKKKEIEPQLL